MDFRSLCILISALALAGGILVGWTDYQRDREARPEPTDSGPTMRPATPQDTGSGARGTPRKRTRGGDRTRTDDGSDSVATTSGDRASDGSSSAARRESLTKITAAQRGEIDAIRGLISEQDFSAAESRARQMAENAEGLARAKARQLEAKAIVFDRLVPKETSAGAQTTPNAREILLANRQTLVATSVATEYDGYDVKLISGTNVRLRKEEVLEVRDLDPKAYNDQQRKILERRVRHLSHPIDLYLRGVRKYYQHGLRDEGYELLERLLSMPDGEQVPLVFGGNEGDELLGYWEEASGKGVKAIEQASSGDLVARGPNGSTASTGTESTPGNTQPDRHDDTGSQDTGTSAGATTTGTVDAETLGKIHQAYGQAVALYRAARGVDDRGADLEKAYQTLLAVQEKLHELPETDEVRKLRRKVGVTIYDVYKASPFLEGGL